MAPSSSVAQSILAISALLPIALSAWTLEALVHDWSRTSAELEEGWLVVDGIGAVAIVGAGLVLPIREKRSVVRGFLLVAAALGDLALALVTAIVGFMVPSFERPSRLFGVIPYGAPFIAGMTVLIAAAFICLWGIVHARSVFPGAAKFDRLITSGRLERTTPLLALLGGMSRMVVTAGVPVVALTLAVGALAAVLH